MLSGSGTLMRYRLPIGNSQSATSWTERANISKEHTMKKLSLKLDDLRVDTFQTLAEAGERGTVAGHAPTVVGNTCTPSCPYTCGIIPQTENCRFGARDTQNCPVCG
jgi:hypothetical protein